jgi:hypothetical protein
MTIHVARTLAAQSAVIKGSAARPFVLALQAFVCDLYTSAGCMAPCCSRGKLLKGSMRRSAISASPNA